MTSTPLLPAMVLPAPLWRRLLAALYDALVLAGLLMAVTMVDLFLLRGVLGLSYEVHVLRAELLGAAVLFFGLSWTRGGQSPGMRAWRLQVRRVDGRALTWPDALARFAFAVVAWLPLGLGVLWCAIDSRKRAWHDSLSSTEVVLLPKP